MSKTGIVISAAQSKKLKSLDTAATRIINALSDVDKFTYDKLVELNEQITEKSEQLETLEYDYNQKLREHEVDLSLKVKENREKTFTSLAGTLGYAVVGKDDYANLSAEKAQLEEELGDIIEKAVSDAEASHQRQLSSAVSNAKMKAETEMATINAENSQLKQTIEYYKEANRDLKNQVENLRQTINNFASAQSAVVNVGQGK